MSRYYLIHESIEPLRLDRWYVLERGVDFTRLPKPVAKAPHMTTYRQVIYQADTLPDMLHQMHTAKDWRFYVVDDTLSSKGEKVSEKYPHHRHICSLAGFIPAVCDIRLEGGKPYFGAKWELRYQSQLWVCHGGWGGDCLYKVEGFTEKMDRAVEEYMKEHGLTMGMEDEDT